MKDRLPETSLEVYTVEMEQRKVDRAPKAIAIWMYCAQPAEWQLHLYENEERLNVQSMDKRSER